MAYSFTWAGVSSTTHGLYVEKITPPIRPATRQERTPIPGKDGYLTTGDSTLGEVMRYAECYLPDLTKRDAILAWLQGSGNVIFSTESDRYCKATILDQIEFTNDVLPANFLIVPFACQPYRYLYPETSVTLVNGGVTGTFNNTGTAPAEPVISLTGTGDIALTIGAKTLYIDDLSGDITIDVPAGLAYNGTVNLTYKLTGDWPFTIATGANATSWTGTLTAATMLPNRRYY